MDHIHRTLRIHKSEVFLTKIGHVVAKKPKRPYFVVAQMHQSELTMSLNKHGRLENGRNLEVYGSLPFRNGRLWSLEDFGVLKIGTLWEF